MNKKQCVKQRKYFNKLLNTEEHSNIPKSDIKRVWRKFKKNWVRTPHDVKRKLSYMEGIE